MQNFDECEFSPIKEASLPPSSHISFQIRRHFEKKILFLENVAMDG